MSDDLVKRLRFDWPPVFSACVGTMIDAANRITELEAALHKIADRTKRAHPQAQEGEIHHIAITALTNNTQENING